MNALEELEKRLGIVSVNFSNMDIMNTFGAELTAPPSPEYEVDSYPQIKLSTFGKLDQLWNAPPKTAQNLFNKLVEHSQSLKHSMTSTAEKQREIIQRILASMQYGNLPKVKLNDMLNELALYGE